jgi:hypothetical protein
MADRTSIRWWFGQQSGAPLPSARLHTYLAGTDTRAPVFSTPALDTAHANPVVANAAGVFPPIFMDARAYRFELHTSSGVPIYPPLEPVTAAETMRWFDVTTYGGRNQAAVDAAVAALAAADGGVLYFPAGDPYVVTQIVIPDRTWVLGDGAGATTIRAPGYGRSRGIIRNADASGGNHDVKVSDLTIERTSGLGTGFNDLVFFSNSDHIWIQRCEGRHVGSAAPGPFGEKGLSIDGCRFFWITDNEVIDAPDNSIVAAWSGALLRGYGYVERNTIRVPADHLQKGFTHSGIIVTASNVVVRDNVSRGAVAQLIEIGDDCEDLLVEGNQLRDAAATSNMLIIGAAAGTMRRYQIRENRCDGTAQAGIAITAVSGGIQADHVVTSNPGCRLLAQRQRGGTFTNLAVSGRHRAVHCEGIVGLSVQRADVTNQFDRDAGFRIVTCERFVVEDSRAVGCAGDGFFVEGSAANGSTGRLENNAAIDNGGWGYSYEQPQNLYDIANGGSGNRSGLRTVANATRRGTLPFLETRAATDSR